MSDEAAKELAAAILLLAQAINAFTSKCSPFGGFEVRHSGFPQDQLRWKDGLYNGSGGGSGGSLT